LTNENKARVWNQNGGSLVCDLMSRWITRWATRTGASGAAARLGRHVKSFNKSANYPATNSSAFSVSWKISSPLGASAVRNNLLGVLWSVDTESNELRRWLVVQKTQA
jgi:hypothetical protein